MSDAEVQALIDECDNVVAFMEALTIALTVKEGGTNG